jgi:hypothetical protein
LRLPLFLSSSGTWDYVKGERIEPIPASSLSEFHPQVLFFLVDERNRAAETSALIRVGEDVLEPPAAEPVIDSFSQRIAERLDLACLVWHNRQEPPEVAVVDGRTKNGGGRTGRSRSRAQKSLWRSC